MSGTVILQSHRSSGVPTWIGRCIESVRGWARGAEFDYRFIGERMMDAVPAEWRRATAAHSQIAADLGRLYLIREALSEGADQAIWIDADVIVFDPASFMPCPQGPHAFGREVWVQSEGREGFRARHNVHNACMAFRPGTPVLEFYIHACERILARIAADGAGGSVPPQIIGPKLLGALHNIVGFPLIDDVAMISPPVLCALAGNGDERALACFRRAAVGAPAAANLSASLVGGSDAPVADRAIDRLTAAPALLSPLTERERAS